MWKGNALLGILLSIVCQENVAASVTLTPTVVHACPGEPVNFTCIVTGGDILDWSVNYVDPSSSDVSLRFTATSHPGYKLLNNNVGYTFRFTLISASPGPQLTSTATTTISGPQLNGTQVQCQSSSSASTSVIQVITGPASVSSLAVIDVISGTGNVVIVHVSLNVTVQNTAIGDHKYFVAVSPSDESGLSNFVTLNKTIQLTVLYNREYNVTVVANNCAGNSSAVSTTFNISAFLCGRPVHYPNVTVEGFDSQTALKVSQITYYCQDGLLPNERMVANCTKNGNWDPDPAELICEVDCGFPVLPDGIEVLHDPYSTKEGTVITLSCAEYLSRLNHNFTTTCTSDGKWNPDPSTYNCLKVDMKAAPTAGWYPKRCGREDNSWYKVVTVSVSVTCFILGVVAILVTHLCWRRCCKKICRQNSKVKGQRQDDTCEPVYAECTLPSTHVCDTINNQPDLNMGINTAYGRHCYIYI